MTQEIIVYIILGITVAYVIYRWFVQPFIASKNNQVDTTCSDCPVDCAVHEEHASHQENHNEQNDKK